MIYGFFTLLDVFLSLELIKSHWPYFIMWFELLMQDYLVLINLQINHVQRITNQLLFAVNTEENTAFCSSVLRNYVYTSKTNLKIQKGLSESVHRRRTDNTMTIRTSNDLQNIHIQLKIKYKSGVNSSAPEGKG